MPYLYKSPAKVNLFLNILRKRKDGYHDIQSIFQLIDLQDEIIFKKRNDCRINLKCNLKSQEQDNFIIKAINNYSKISKIENNGLEFTLKKHITI